MSYGIGCRCGSDPLLLWLWHRLAATALTGPLAWEPPCAVGAALKKIFLNKNKKEEKSQINNLTHHLNELEKEEQTKPKVSIRKS